ncbi:MAG: site-specific integrase [Candidatus Marinimicrobia bacterium]|mgnify:FL=1|jgi:integrase|nr:site-specific integrase [Candidatus Neomarinimicrobiota bacterium]
MASVYRKSTGVYYLAVTFQNSRITRSLGTHCYETAKKVTPQIEKQILSELISGVNEKKPQNLSFNNLVSKYLKYQRHDWANSTRKRNKELLKKYLVNGFPDNSTTKAMTIRVINACNNWGFKHGLINKPIKIEGGSKWESRNRVLSDSELKTLLDEIKDNRFNLFVRFAYYTGARSGEIRSISRENIFSNHIVAYGKSGKRLIKLNHQAQEILDGLDELWDYTKDFVSHKFKKEARRLGIPDIRFHDLRRTFGYNLIRQGRPIYEVSKLLGHSSVTTTERHYAPLLATEIDDFVL